MNKRVLLSTALLLLLATSHVALAHKTVEDEEVAAVQVDSQKQQDDFIEVPSQKGAHPAEEVYTGPKDFNYCKHTHTYSC